MTHCPHCGRFCGQITGHTGYSDLGPYLWRVTGTCKIHGEVMLPVGDWTWDDFFD